MYFSEEHTDEDYDDSTSNIDEMAEEADETLAQVGVKVRNMKMDFTTGGTWHQVGQWKLMMKIYDFCYLGKLFSHPV